MPAAAALVCHKPWLSDGRRYGDYLLQFTAAFSANGEVNTLALIHVTRPIFRCSGGLPPLPTERCPPGFVQATPRPSRSRQVRTRLSFARGGGPSAAIRGRDPQAGQSPRWVAFLRGGGALQQAVPSSLQLAMSFEGILEGTRHRQSPISLIQKRWQRWIVPPGLGVKVRASGRPVIRCRRLAESGRIRVNTPRAWCLPVQGPRSATSEPAHVGGVSPGGQHRPVRMLRADPTIKLIVYPRMGLVGPNGSQTSTNR